MTTKWRRGALWIASAGLALSVSACATGQGSFVAGSGGGGGDEQAFAEDQTFEETAPGLLAASGNALLPGGRSFAASSPATAVATPSGSAPPLLSTGPVAANVDASVSLLNGAAVSANLATSLASVRTNLNLGGPLLALNGSQAALLGSGVTGPTGLGSLFWPPRQPLPARSPPRPRPALPGSCRRTAPIRTRASATPSRRRAFARPGAACARRP
jgi:hypothetical protein